MKLKNFTHTIWMATGSKFIFSIMPLSSGKCETEYRIYDLYESGRHCAKVNEEFDDVGKAYEYCKRFLYLNGCPKSQLEDFFGEKNWS